MDGSEALIHLRVPAELKARWVRESRAAGMRLTDWITSKVEKEMARQTYPGLDGVVIECDLDQAASPVRYSTDGGLTFRATPYQVADGRHDADRIAELVDGWLDAQG
jgi:hypothetical protein